MEKQETETKKLPRSASPRRDERNRASAARKIKAVNPQKSPLYLLINVISENYPNIA
jgi:hypothetical protein